MDFDFTTLDAMTLPAGESAPAFAEHATPRRPSRARRVAPRRRDFGDEAYLIERLRASDEAAYAYLMEHHRERMSAIARRYFSEEEDVRDAVQEAFVSVFRSIERFEGKAALSTWLHRVVVNACLMKLRSRRRKPEQSLTPTIAGTLVSSSAASALATLEERELAERVREAIEALPEPHRSVIRLRDLEERDTLETARALVISKAAVKTRLHRARGALRSQLESQADPVARSA